MEKKIGNRRAIRCIASSLHMTSPPIADHKLKNIYTHTHIQTTRQNSLHLIFDSFVVHYFLFCLRSGMFCSVK